MGWRNPRGDERKLRCIGGKRETDDRPGAETTCRECGSIVTIRRDRKVPAHPPMIRD